MDLVFLEHNSRNQKEGTKVIKVNLCYVPNISHWEPGFCCQTLLYTICCGKNKLNCVGGQFGSICKLLKYV